ncbi:MAG: hypothetical protein WCH34_01740 [Bacteroidota bacterium]
MNFRNLKVRIAFLFISIFVIGGMLFSCQKDSEHSPPTITLTNDNGFASADTTLSVGAKVKIGIYAHGLGANITYFNVSIDNGTNVQTLLDSGLNASELNWSYEVIKSYLPVEKWIFTVMDKDRNKSSVSISLTKSAISQYGNIISFNNITLGAQNNSSFGNFFSFNTGQAYSLNDAFIYQDSIDMIYYFGSYLSTLSSPMEAEAPNYYTGVNGVANWTVQNETRYDTTDAPLSSFHTAMNDSLILAVYNPIDAKRKAKYLTNGMLISFIDHNGKLGLIEITSVTEGDTGRVVMNIKRQE